MQMNTHLSKLNPEMLGNCQKLQMPPVLAPLFIDVQKTQRASALFEYKKQCSILRIDDKKNHFLALAANAAPHQEVSKKRQHCAVKNETPRQQKRVFARNKSMAANKIKTKTVFFGNTNKKPCRKKKKYTAAAAVYLHISE